MSWIRSIGTPTSYNTNFGIANEPLRLLPLKTIAGFVRDHIITVPPKEGESGNEVEDDSSVTFNGPVLSTPISEFAAEIVRFLSWSQRVRHNAF